MHEDNFHTKVLFISLYGQGGMAQYSSQLVNAMGRINKVAFIGPDHINKGYFLENIQMKLISAPPSIILSLFYLINIIQFKDLFSYINNFNPDIVHFLNDHPWNNIILKSIKCKTILTCHDATQHPGERNTIVSYLFNKSQFIQMNCVDKIIVHGVAIRKQLVEMGMDGEKIITIPIGDFSFFKDFAKINDIDFNRNSSNSILFFGRIKQYKGIEYLIQAEQIMSKIKKDYKIIIAGPGDFSPYRTLISNANNYIIINKYLEDSEVASLFQSSSIVILPYVEGSQSAVIPIAYAFEKPVIVTDVGSLPEIVEDGITGLVVPSKDAHALAGAIIELMSNPTMRINMGKNGRNFLETRLSWNKIAEQTNEIYENLINNK